MATYAFPKKINRCKLSTLFPLLIFLICLFFLNRRALVPKLFLDTDRISETPLTPPLSPPRSTEFRDELANLSQPVSSSSSAGDNVDGSVTASEKLPEPEPELQEEIKEEDVASKFDFDDKANEKPDDSESQDDSSESNGEPISSDEEKVVPVLSESDEAQDDSGERTDEPVSSGEETTVPNSSESVENGGFIDNAIVEKLRNCDIYKGTWVKDEGYPLYKPGSCPYVDDGFNCQSNGRPDSGYTQWRWKPDECELPRFNATDFLVRLRGKRLMLVGDSMNRNQFESLLCLLREGLPDKSRMYETHGYKITKGRGYYIFKFTDYDCTVEFVRSHFLVREGVRINGQGNSNPTLSIDRIDKTAARWLRADILVFNTGHWWTHGKTSRGKNYYKEGDYVYPKFDPVEAYRRAITTWATWIKNNIKPKKLVFYRGYSTAHFRGGDWDSGGSCKGEAEPVVRGAIIDSYPQKMRIVEEVFKKTQVPVVLLNVTRLTNYRKDGHPSVYGKNVTLLKKVSTRRQDCSHWCLPGVPDAWNELIYATLVARQT